MQAEASITELTAALGAARAERATLEAIHGSLLATEHYQSDLLQAAQAAKVAGNLEGEEREAHSLTQAGRAAAAAAQPRVVTRFVEAIGGWTQRTVARVANLVQKGLFEILVCGNYQPSDADMRCAGGRPLSAWRPRLAP